MQGVQLLTYFQQLYMLASGELAWRPEPSRGFGSHARCEHDIYVMNCYKHRNSLKDISVEYVVLQRCQDPGEEFL
jgi:hypothetical protein